MVKSSVIHGLWEYQQKGTLSKLQNIRELLLRIISTILLILVVSPVSARMIENPQGAEIVNLYRNLAGKPVNFEKEALKAPEYYQADEFDKPQVLQQVIKQMRARYHAAADIDVIRLRTQARFSEYDSALGAYKFDLFKPGAGFSFRERYGPNISLTLENEEEFRNWVLSVPDARAIRQEARYGQVVLELDIRPFDISPTRANTIWGQITGLKVFLKKNSRLVHEKSLEAGQYRRMAGAANLITDQPLDPSKHVLQGLPEGASKDAMLNWAAKAGFKVKEMRNSYRISTNDEALNHSLSGMEIATDYKNSAVGIFGKNLDCRTRTQNLYQPP